MKKQWKMNFLAMKNVFFIFLTKEISFSILSQRKICHIFLDSSVNGDQKCVTSSDLLCHVTFFFQCYQERARRHLLPHAIGWDVTVTAYQTATTGYNTNTAVLPYNTVRWMKIDQVGRVWGKDTHTDKHTHTNTHTHKHTHTNTHTHIPWKLHTRNYLSKYTFFHL